MPAEDVAGGRKEIADAGARGCARPGTVVGQMRAVADLERERERERVGAMGSAQGTCFMPALLQACNRRREGGKWKPRVGGKILDQKF